MKRYAWLLFLVLLYQFSSAQSGVVRGVIIDTAEQKPVPNSVIAILGIDSTLLSFTRSDGKGAFQLSQLPTGTFRILVSSSRFADYSDLINIQLPVTELGRIALTSKIVLLNEVIVWNRSPFRVKGDTTEFIADSFLLKEGATVEDLLKK